MKRRLPVMGVVLILIAAGVGFYFYSSQPGNSLNASGKTYVENNLPPILSTWSTRALRQRAAPRLRQAIDNRPKQLQKLFQRLSGLGTFKNLEKVKGQARKGKRITAHYTATGRFQHGHAQISVHLVQVSGQWRILMLNMTSTVFHQQGGH